MLDAGSTGIQHTDLTARMNGGRTSHHRQLPLEIGWPHRSHRGDGRHGRRDQHKPQTIPVSSRDSRRSQETQARGRRRSRAPATCSRIPSRWPIRARAATAALPRDPARSRTSDGTKARPARVASVARPPRDCLSFVPPLPMACLLRDDKRDPSPRPSSE
jgi:hypothetical protein